ncbi:MAG: alpha/beta hydrolase [Deltaproteobacteria bacterium]|nr:alpha/beta hydrolase [Deltaproteobacteria bacterium]
MISPDQWRATGKTFEWQGQRVFYRVDGSGEPLLAIHGFPTASWDWAAIWPQLTARYRVIALDMIGFGFSAKPIGFPYSIFAQADLHEALLARERVTSYRLLAHDYGDTVAQELLARQSGARAKIVAACLLNGGLFPERHRPLLTQKLLASTLGPLIAKLSSYKTFARAMNRTWGTTRPADDELRAMWQLISHDDGMAVMPSLIGYIDERRRYRARWVGALINATAPLRFINGLADPISGAHMAARYRELVPHADVVELPGVGHYPQIEAPEAVAAAVLEQLARA